MITICNIDAHPFSRYILFNIDTRHNCSNITNNKYATEKCIYKLCMYVTIMYVQNLPIRIYFSFHRLHSPIACQKDNSKTKWNILNSIYFSYALINNHHFIFNSPTQMLLVLFMNCLWQKGWGGTFHDKCINFKGLVRSNQNKRNFIFQNNDWCIWHNNDWLYLV